MDTHSIRKRRVALALHWHFACTDLSFDPCSFAELTVTKPVFAGNFCDDPRRLEFHRF